MYYPKEYKVGVKYEDQRDLESFTSYLGNYSSVVKESGISAVELSNNARAYKESGISIN